MPLIKLSERSSHVQNGFVYRLVVLSGFKKEAEKYYYLVRNCPKKIVLNGSGCKLLFILLDC
jgi:hypothetical protein